MFVEKGISPFLSFPLSPANSGLETSLCIGQEFRKGEKFANFYLQAHPFISLSRNESRVCTCFPASKQTFVESLPGRTKPGSGQRRTDVPDTGEEREEGGRDVCCMRAQRKERAGQRPFWQTLLLLRPKRRRRRRRRRLFASCRQTSSLENGWGGKEGERTEGAAAPPSFSFRHAAFRLLYPAPHPVTHPFLIL